MWQILSFPLQLCWHMTPAALWVTWTQPHTIITAAIGNYQSRLIKSACFTLHNGAIISFLHLNVSLNQFIFQWDRCMPAGGAHRLKNRLACFLGWSHSLRLWVHFFFHCCGTEDLLKIRSEVSPHLPVHAGGDHLESLRIISCQELLRIVWGANPPPDPPVLYGSITVWWADASGSLNLSVWEICCVRYDVLGAQRRQEGNSGFRHATRIHGQV